MVWLANAGLVHNYIILLCAAPLWHLGVTVVGEELGKSDLPKLISIHVVSQHTEAARTTTKSTAAAEATATTARKVTNVAQTVRMDASQVRAPNATPHTI
jgi:hypothetical protein